MSSLLSLTTISLHSLPKDDVPGAFQTFQLLSLELASRTGHSGALLEAAEEEEAGSRISRYARYFSLFSC